MFKELKEVIERELDFTKEKNTLLFFKERFKEVEMVQVPGVYEELCTDRVLVMEWVKGISLTDKEAVDQLEVSRAELARRLVQVFLPQWLEPGIFHADPHSGNVLVTREGQIVLLDFGMVGEITKKDATYFQGLIESFLAKNYRKAVDNLVQLGFLLPEADPRTIERVLVEWSTFQPAQLMEMDILALKLEMNDMIQQLPIQVRRDLCF
ncbi:MAG: AarF/ABC1/UbiB kinase family protein [Bacillus sp. (in: Bacteria)]|nr:AarF/ABC1/UbiB kinase family protein [Bacillus sp. (in: firmicutes)]